MNTRARRSSATVRASLYDWQKNTTVAATTIQLPLKVESTQATSSTADVANGFTQVHFNLTANASALCSDVISCAGEFRLEVVGAGAVSFDFVFLQPGEWGRFKGLSVLKSGADLLAQMGIKAIRQGGSFAGNSPWYEWTRWTGPVWNRSSAGAAWGHEVIAGWGPFDFISFANAAGIEPIMTTTSTTSSASFANLVEYCHGDATTEFGRKRIADGHPEPYGVRFFELGNEGSDGQKYTFMIGRHLF